MNPCRRSAGRALVLLTVALALIALSVPPADSAEPARVQSRQLPGQEPPIADGTAPYAPNAPGGQGATQHPPTPAVSIRVTVPSTVMPGRELEYHIVVENVSQADANHVVVKVPVPAHVRYKTAQPVPSSPPASGELIWNLGTLKPGKRTDITFVVEVEPGAVADINCCARVVFEHGECVRTRIPKPTLRVRTEGPERAKLYDILTYKLEVSNTGTVAANDVVLSVDLPPGLAFSDSTPSTSGSNPLTWKLGTVFPGQPSRVEFKVIPNQPGTHPLKATLAANGIKAVEENLSRVLVGEPKLSLLKTGPAVRSADRDAVYFLTVSNSGTTPATNVEIFDDVLSTPSLRSNIQVVSVSDDGKLTGNDVRWQIGTLNAGSRRTVSLTLRPVKGAYATAAFDNSARVQADRGLTATAFCKTEFVTPAGLTLDIEKGADPIAVGKTTVFTLRLRQIGAASSRSVGLTVTLPDELQYVDASGPSAGTQDGKTVGFASLGELAPGGVAVYTVTVRGERAAEVTIRASVTADPLPKGGKIERRESTIILPEIAAPSQAPVLEKSAAK
jgi:uncharacterized repeat protein (TIGR01451 family)